MRPGKLIHATKLNDTVITQAYYSLDPLTDISHILNSSNLFSMDLSDTLTVFHSLCPTNNPYQEMTICMDGRTETFQGEIIFAGRDILKNVISLDPTAEEEIRLKIKEIR